MLSLALGIGANTAIFTLFDQVLLRLLPVRDPDSLVMIASRGSHSGNNRGSNAISYPMFEDYRERNEVFDGVACRFGTEVNVGWSDATERTTVELVSGNYFELLGVGAAVGRTFTMADETAAGANPLVDPRPRATGATASRATRDRGPVGPRQRSSDDGGRGGGSRLSAA